MTGIENDRVFGMGCSHLCLGTRHRMQKGDGHQSTFIGISLWKEGKHMKKLMFFLKKTLQSTHEHRFLCHFHEA